MFEDEAILALEPPLHGAVVWVALVVTADAMGRTEGSPEALCATTLAGYSERLAACGAPPFTAGLVESLLAQLEASGRVRRYRVAGRQHLELVNFGKHNRLKHPIAERPGWPEAYGPARAPSVAGTARPQPGPTAAVEVPAPGPSQARRSVPVRLAEAVKQRFAGDKRYNYYALAMQLLARGHKDIGTICEALAYLAAQPGKHPNPWAFVNSAGVLGVGTAVAVEKRVTAERVDPRGPTRVGAVLTEALRRASTEGANGTEARQARGAGGGKATT